MPNVVIKDSIHIEAPPEAVWDFTQDWTRRHLWDPGIVSAEILVEGAGRTVSARARGGLTMKVRYKLSDRPHRTSLEMFDFKPAIFSGGGGAWIYEAEGTGTRFSQTNTLTIRSKLRFFLLAAFTRWQLRRNTRRSLENAKSLLESRGTPQVQARP